MKSCCYLITLVIILLSSIGNGIVLASELSSSHTIIHSAQENNAASDSNERVSLSGNNTYMMNPLRIASHNNHSCCAKSQCIQWLDHCELCYMAACVDVSSAITPAASFVIIDKNELKQHVIFIPPPTRPPQIV